MKNCDEMVNSLFERREQYIIEQKRKRKVFVRTATSMCCVCLIALFVFGMLQGGFFNMQNPSIDVSGKDDGIPAESSDGDFSDAPSYVIIWADDNGTADSGFTEMNGKNVSLSLSYALRNAPENSKVAIIAFPSVIDQDFVYNGKSIKEYQEDVNAELELSGRLGMLLKLGDDLKYGEALYKTGTPEGEKWWQTYYEETVETIGEELLSKYIVNGIFLKAELEADMVASQGVITAQNNYDLACAAYQNQAVSEVKKGLNAQKIDCDKSTYAGCDYVVIYASEEEFSALSFEGISNWFFGFASKNNDDGQDFLTSDISG